MPLYLVHSDLLLLFLQDVYFPYYVWLEDGDDIYFTICSQKAKVQTLKDTLIGPSWGQH